VAGDFPEERLRSRKKYNSGSYPTQYEGEKGGWEVVDRGRTKIPPARGRSNKEREGGERSEVKLLGKLWGGKKRKGRLS